MLHPERAPDAIPENSMALGAQAQGLQSLPEQDTV
jgi:hypothetical protein